MRLDLEKENGICAKKLPQKLLLLQIFAGALVLAGAVLVDIRAADKISAEIFVRSKGIALGVLFYTVNFFGLIGIVRRMLGLDGEIVSARSSGVVLIIKSTFFFSALILMATLGKTLFFSFLLGFTAQMIVGMFLALSLSTKFNR